MDKPVGPLPRHTGKALGNDGTLASPATRGKWRACEPMGVIPHRSAFFARGR